MTSPTATAESFGDALLKWYALHGRGHLPWRTERSPYRTVLSEFMLAQTQVDRVVPAFRRFVAEFDSFANLAAAAQAEVVRAWCGLGYNSRAVRLHQLTVAVRDRFGGALPRDEATLRTLPGVGKYTARAILAFGFDADVVAIDTNIRRVMHRVRFGLEYPRLASDAQIDEAATELLPRGHGHEFNSALMDLGATVCTARAPKCLVCPLRSLCAAAPIDRARVAQLAAIHARPRGLQERIPFQKTTRFARGRIIDRLRALAPDQAISLLELERDLAQFDTIDAAMLPNIVSRLAADGVVACDDAGVRLA